MAIYHIYTATKSNGDPTAMAIDPALLGVPDFDFGEGELSKVEDFFVPDTTEIKKTGEIEIEGDTYLLDDYFCVRH